MSIRLDTERLTAVFDIDGVLALNPVESLTGGPITNNDYWHRHWSRPEDATLHESMFNLANALTEQGWQIVMLSARPGQYLAHTKELLQRGMMKVPPIELFPDENVPRGSSSWKQLTIKRWLDEGVKIQFMVEDYRVNAEGIRALVPVLLYERKKPSAHFRELGSCERCGGLAAHWSPCEPGIVRRADV